MAEEKKKTAKELKEERLKKIQDIAGLIRKDLGDDSIMLSTEVKEVKATTSGSISLDLALGVGGFPNGRVIEIYGMESSGKTTLTLHAIAEQQRAGRICAFIDAEHALDPVYAKSIGVNMEELLISQPNSGEHAAQIAMRLAQSGQVDCIVIDSVAALTPQKEIDGEVGDTNVGLQARLMSQFLRKLTPVAGANNVTVFFINQIRMKIGVMFGDPRTTSGGEALKFYSSVRLAMLSGAKNKDPKTGQLLGGTLKVRVVKNKVAAPFSEAEIPVITGKGIDSVADVFEVAKSLFKDVKDENDGPFRVAGGHTYFYGQGLEKDKLASSGKEAVEKLRAEPKLFKALDAAVRKKFKDALAEAQNS